MEIKQLIYNMFPYFRPGGKPLRRTNSSTPIREDHDKGFSFMDDEFDDTEVYINKPQAQCHHSLSHIHFDLPKSIQPC